MAGFHPIPLPPPARESALPAGVQVTCAPWESWLPTLPAESTQAVVTSPPYNQGAAPSAYEHPGSARGQALDWQGYANGDPDALPEPIYQAQQGAFLVALYRVCALGASVFYIHKDRLWDGHLISPLLWLARGPFHIRQTIIWDRGSTHQHAGFYFAPQHEYVFWLTKGKWTGRLEQAAAWSSVWRIPPEWPPTYTDLPRHPAPFPRLLVRRCLLAVTDPGDLVLDPQVGSGTTGVVAVELGRRFAGADRVAPYVTGARRWIAATAPQPPGWSRTRPYQLPLAGLPAEKSA